MFPGWAGLAVVLAGCTVGPDFHPPAADAPRDWQAERTDVASHTVTGAVDPRWWNSFGDPMLSSLVARAARQNLDLQAAAERILQGRAQREVVASQGLPQINEQSSYQRTRYSLVGNPISLVSPAPGAPAEFDVFQNGLSSSWELDLFGRVRRGVEAENADTQAAIEDRRGIALSVIAELAQDYLQLRGVQAQQAIAERNLALARQDTDLVDRRFADGVATTLDIAQARAQQATIAATTSPLRTQEAMLINAIGLLLGEHAAGAGGRAAAAGAAARGAAAGADRAASDAGAAASGRAARPRPGCTPPPRRRGSPSRSSTPT